MDDKKKINKIILAGAYFLIVFLILTIIALIIYKYEIEGEKNMPFIISNLVVVSNAEGQQLSEENNNYLWNENIYQNNDIYINIEKNKNYKETEIIKKINITNIMVNKQPEIGKIEIYRANNEEGENFVYKDELKINNEIIFNGNIQTNIKNLEIANQGGTIFFRILNNTEKQYLSNDNIIEHNGKLLEKVGISYEQIKFNISFDIIISLESDIEYKATVNLELPVGDIIKEGSSNIELKDMDKIIFKRK